VEQQRQLTVVHRALAALEAEPAGDAPDAARKRARADLEEQVKQLQELQKAYQDPGPLYGACACRRCRSRGRPAGI
jgi:hypothetical protein